jgi:hypothetical protein
VGQTGKKALKCLSDNEFSDRFASGADVTRATRKNGILPAEATFCLLNFECNYSGLLKIAVSARALRGLKRLSRLVTPTTKRAE